MLYQCKEICIIQQRMIISGNILDSIALCCMHKTQSTIQWLIAVPLSIAKQSVRISMDYQFNREVNHFGVSKRDSGINRERQRDRETEIE